MIMVRIVRHSFMLVLMSAGPGVASHLGVTAEECEFLAKSISAHKEPWVSEFARNPAIMDVVKRLKPHWQDPLLFMRQLLRSNMPNVCLYSLFPRNRRGQQGC